LNKEGKKMITSGIEKIVISVGSMDESLAFYRDQIGMKVVAEQRLEPEKIQKLWDLSLGTEAQAVFLKNEEQSTLLELIEFQPNSGKTIRGGAQPWDYGIYDIAFLVGDLEKTYKDLVGKGFRFLSPPIPYSPDWVPYDVKENILIGPNEMPIALIELVNAPPSELKGAFGRIVDSAQAVENIDEVIRFYGDILGLSLQWDMKLPRGLIDEVLMLPQKTDVRIALFNKEGSEGPFVEFLEYSCKGKSLASVAKPPNLGVFMISFETDDLSGLIEKFNKENVKIVSGPIKMEVAPHGMVKTIVVEGPSKVMIELFEKQ
jgi:catechol 2,3-dioxygenase-like lactoylglutathione lyase family enzyme